MGRQTKLKLETSLNIRTCINCFAIIALFGLSSFSLNAKAQEDDSAALIAIIDAVEKGWEQAD